MRTALAIPLIDDSRGRRVAELLIVVCILSLADLIFTVWAHVVTPMDFVEVNPLPGVHPVHSDLVILSYAAGWTYDQLIAGIMTSAEARWRA